MAGTPQKNLVVWVDVSPFPKGICSGEQWKNPGCLRFIGNYTTHIIFRDCDKPLYGSLSNNQYSIMENNKILKFFVVALEETLSWNAYIPQPAQTFWQVPHCVSNRLFCDVHCLFRASFALGSLQWPWEGGWSAPQGSGLEEHFNRPLIASLGCQTQGGHSFLVLGPSRPQGQLSWRDSLALVSQEGPWEGGWEGQSRHRGQLSCDSLALGSLLWPWEGGWSAPQGSGLRPWGAFQPSAHSLPRLPNTRGSFLSCPWPEPTSRPTLLERLPCIGQPRRAVRRWLRRAEPTSRPTLLRLPCIGQPSMAMRRWLKRPSRLRPWGAFQPSAHSLPRLPNTRGSFLSCPWPEPTSRPTLLERLPCIGQPRRAVRRWLRRAEPTSRPTLLERLPCIGQPRRAVRRWLRRAEPTSRPTLLRLPCIGQPSMAMRRWLKRPSRLRPWGAFQPSAHSLPRLPNTRGSFLSCPWPEPTSRQPRRAVRRWLRRAEPTSRPTLLRLLCIAQPSMAMRRWWKCSESSGGPFVSQTKRPRDHQHSNRFAVLILFFPMIHSESCEKGKTSWNQPFLLFQLECPRKLI